MLKTFEATLDAMDDQAKIDPSQFTKDFLTFRDELMESKMFLGSCARITRALADCEDQALGIMLVNTFACMIWQGYETARAELQNAGLEKLLGVVN